MNSLKIVSMNGDLESQLYQYTFLHFLELNTGQNCLVDDSDFFVRDSEYEYQLEKIFNIKLNLLSRYFTEDVWKEMILAKEQGIIIPQQLLDNGMDLMMITDSKDYQFEGNVIYFNPNLLDNGIMNAYLQAKGIIYYHGKFRNEVFYSVVRKDLQQKLVFPELVETLEINTINVLYQNLIRITQSVAIYIKKEDMLNQNYEKIIHALKVKELEYIYFVFSDDIDWCKKHCVELGLEEINKSIYYVEENKNTAHIDIQLMSLCKIMILPKDSIALWAYKLNRRPDVELICVDK